MRDTMLRDQGSSVDYLLKAHDSNLPIYSCPLFVTKNSDVIMWGSLLLNPDGFFVKNDVIASEPSLGQEELYLYILFFIIVQKTLCLLRRKGRRRRGFHCKGRIFF